MEMENLEKLFVNSFLFNKTMEFFINRPFLRKVKNNPKKILEIGCGIGKTTKSIAEFFPSAKITATDYDGRQIIIAEQNKIPNASFERGDAKHLQFKSGSFDAVFAFLVFHHVENYEKALKECFRVLKKNGCLCIVELGKFSPHYFQFLFPSPPVFSKEDFADQAVKAGFKIQNLSGNNFIFTLIVNK